MCIRNVSTRSHVAFGRANMDMLTQRDADDMDGDSFVSYIKYLTKHIHKYTMTSL